ncbi:MAG: M14 family metallopeptidase [Pseudomonadota bacterium]
MLNEIDHLPAGLLDLPAEALADALGGPTLIHLPGRREPALFVSVLMHGNETTGWEAVRRWLDRYAEDGGQFSLPRKLSLFIGNVNAAALGLRHLDGQPDYNRVWPGCNEPGSPEQDMMRQVVDIMEARGVFASVDIHNNTGINPHYACVNVVDNCYLHLATMFSRVVVYFLRPRGVQSMAMAQLCPAVTLECGKVGQEHGTDHATEYLEACIHLAEHPAHPVAEHDIDLFHTVATVKVPETLSFSFGEGDGDLRLVEDLEFMNFRELPVGTVFGTVAADQVPLAIRDESGQDVAARFFRVRDGELLTRNAVMPSMLTRDSRVIRQDCLCYLMERYQTHLPGQGDR